MDARVDYYKAISKAERENKETKIKAEATAANFGQYQINWRQQEGASDVLWATNVKTARDSYFSQLADATLDFDETLNDAIETYADTILEAEIARAQALFNAMHAYDEALQSAEHDYLNDSFDAAHEAGSGFVDAGIDEILDNIGGEVDILEPEVEYYSELVETYEVQLNTAMTQIATIGNKMYYNTFLNLLSQWNTINAMQDAVAREQAKESFAASFAALWEDYIGLTLNNPLSFGECGGAINSALQDMQQESGTIIANVQSTLISLKNEVQPKVSTSYGSERYLCEQAVNNAITSLKATNKATREAKEKEITEEYRNAENEAWNEYVVASQTAYIAYATTYKSAENNYQSAKKNADDEYISTVLVAEKEYNDEYCRLTGRYYDAIGYADLGYGVDSTFYENGATSTNVQVCFVAGTPIVLANDVTKPIEEIEIGDIVYAKPHDNPTGELIKCKVTKVFHNAPQQTLKLTFDNGLVIQATKEHPFYVENQGWISADHLEIGAKCVSINSTITKLLNKELIEEKVPVYNFEVESAHTYFVGKSINESVLVHNECPVCQGDKIVQVPRSLVNVFVRNLFNIYSNDGGYYYYEYKECICPRATTDEEVFHQKREEMLKGIENIGHGLHTATDVVADFIPWICAGEAITGEDALVANRRLSNAERAWAVVGALGGMEGVALSKALGGMFKYTDDIARLLAHGDDISALVKKHKTLDAAMSANGIVRIEGTQLHHIVCATDKAAEGSRKILIDNGIGINSAANGVYLPHAGRHTRTYNQEVFNRIKNLDGNPKAILKVLNEVRLDLLNGTLKLGK